MSRKHLLVCGTKKQLPLFERIIKAIYNALPYGDWNLGVSENGDLYLLGNYSNELAEDLEVLTERMVECPSDFDLE